MATTKIIVVRSHLNRAAEYIANPEKTAMKQEIDYAINAEKTEQLLYCDVINCKSVKTAWHEMELVKERFSKQDGVLAYHFIQSFAPGESFPDEVHAIGMEFAERCFGDSFQVLVATHLNCDHLHNHILVNSVCCFDGKKYHSNARSYYEQIRATSDQICKEHGLSVIAVPAEKGKSYVERQAEKENKPTIRQMIRVDVDAALAKAVSWETFVQGLRSMGYQVKYGPHVKYAVIKHKAGSNAIRLKSLGEAYTEQAIRQRIAQRNTSPRKEKTVTQGGLTQSVPPFLQSKQTIMPRRPRQRKSYRGRFPFPEKAKITGFMALYYRYLHLLGKAKTQKTSHRCYYLLREGFLKFDRYRTQCDYLWEHSIQDPQELAAAKVAAQQNIARLDAQRKQLYKLRGCSANGLNKGDLTAQIKAITAQMRPYRAEIRLCDDIQADAAYLEKKLLQVRQAEKRYTQEQQKKNARGKQILFKE